MAGKIVNIEGEVHFTPSIAMSNDGSRLLRPEVLPIVSNVNAQEFIPGEFAQVDYFGLAVNAGDFVPEGAPC